MSTQLTAQPMTQLRNSALTSILLGIAVLVFAPAASYATTIDEVLVAPSIPGSAYSGTFFITPSTLTWAFGVGNPSINDTSISGISFIDGLEANDHWVSGLISRTDWDAGYSFDSARPIGATPPSSFSIDTSSTAWQWGSVDYVAFYWLSEAGSDTANPLAVLQPGTRYDAFKFFTSGPASPFAAFSAADGGLITTGQTIESVVPEPSSAVLLSVGLVALAASRRRE